MTEATLKKSIAELMDGDKPGMLNLLLEHLLAPASPWRYMEPTASLWGQYEHLTLEDFKDDCEWDEKWYVQFQYDVSICNPCKCRLLHPKKMQCAWQVEHILPL